VAGLVLVGGALTARNDAVLALRTELEHLVERIPEEFVERFQASCVHRLESLPEWFFRECVATSLGVPWSVWVGAVEGLLGDQTAARLPEITCPTWVVGGGRDPVFPVAAQEDLARAIPHAGLRLYRHSGHSPHWEEPGRFAEDVFTFVGSVARRPETVSAR